MDEWAEASMAFRSAIHRALDAGMTPGELHNEIEEADAER